MNLPPKASRMTIEYGPHGDVYIETRGKGWSVWDRRPVRQGACHMSDHKTFEDAEAEARRLSLEPSVEQEKK